MKGDATAMSKAPGRETGGRPSAALRVGLTYDLRSHYLALGYSEEQTAEFDSPVTVEAIAVALRELGYVPIRIGHVRELTRRLAAGQRWDLVFNIGEGMYGLGREALIPALLDAYRIAYTFSDPCVMAVSLHKGFTKSIIRDAGLRTPRFALIREEADLDSVDLLYPLFAKPVAEGTGKGIDGSSRIENPAALRRRCLDLLARYRQPVLVEEYLPGREFTVGILGTGSRSSVLGTVEVIIREQGEQGAYSYRNKERCEQLVKYRCTRDGNSRRPGEPDRSIRPWPEGGTVEGAVEGLALRAWRALGCRDAGRVDVRLDSQGLPAVLEVNPLAGLHPAHSDLPMIAAAAGMSYRELIDRIVRSALQRYAPHAAGRGSCRPSTEWSRGCGLSG
jgi:D-alanine-D-alanine ligase